MSDSSFDWSGFSGALLQTTGDLIGGHFNRKSAREINKANIDFQKEVNAQQEQLQREQWAREDNAAQRRAVDLEAAGLNKNLAAGSAASSTLSTRLSAPHADNVPEYSDVSNAFGAYNTYLQLKGMKSDIQNNKNVADSQVELNKANAAKAEAEASKLAKETGWIDSDMSSTIGLREAQSALYNVESEVKANKAVADIKYIDAQIERLTFENNLTNEQIAKVKADTKFTENQESWFNKQVATDVAEKVARTNLLNEQAKQVVYDTVYKKLQSSDLIYNLLYSADAGLRTTDSAGSIAGINATQLAKLASSLVGSLFGSDGSLSVDNLVMSLDNFK